jgi:hypothetical protein
MRAMHKAATGTGLALDAGPAWTLLSSRRTAIQRLAEPV